jgi:hypothetical protein
MVNFCAVCGCCTRGGGGGGGGAKQFKELSFPATKCVILYVGNRTVSFNLWLNHQALGQ